MRDALVLPFSQEELLVVTSDNSGAIGTKEQDTVKVPYKTVSYYSFRVAVMECMVSGAYPISVIIQNFCGKEAWDELVSGIQMGLSELHMENVPITGSTETNFSLTQSALGITVIGKKSSSNSVKQKNLQHQNVALIGLPLIGDQVVYESEEIAPLSLFKDISEIKDLLIWPVGSKGVLHELERIFPELDRDKIMSSSNIDFLKSGGPSTSFIIVYPSQLEGSIMQMAGKHFRKIPEVTTY
ncbi:ATP-binding protein [Bacillus sp. JJ1533]|uniref:ATP-binding protein n=1 Tax=Bacillus sp. JJ1533 TaxID=3122959 RepID=UPI002FFFE833